MKYITTVESRAQFLAQGVSGKGFYAVKCPMCGTVQCMQDLVNVGAGKDLQEVERYFAFSCVGRWTGAPGPRKSPDGKPCNWTLGGLFKMHNTVLICDDGTEHPIFDIATPCEAQHNEELIRAVPRNRRAA